MIDFLEPTATADIIPLRRGYMRKVEKSATSLFDSSYRTRVVTVVLTFHIPQSVHQDFQDYVGRILEQDWGRMWRDTPFIQALGIGIPEKGKWGWDKPFNKRFNGPSRKAILKRIKVLAKREPLVAVTDEIHPDFWERIQERAAFYGVTPGDLCLSCIGYHAGLERRRREEEKPKTSFDTFERALAKEARQSPDVSRIVEGGRP